MTASRRLRIHHELLLLALHDKKGTLAFGQMQHIGLAGGIFAELLLEGRLAVVEERHGRKLRPLVQVVDATRFGEGVMDAGLRKLSEAKRRASPKDAVGRLGGMKRLHHEVGRELARMGVLRATEEDVLLFFKRRVYPTVDPGPEREVVGRVRDALEGTGEPDARTTLLVALAHGTRTLRSIYDRKALKSLKSRIEEISLASGVGGEAAGEAIRAAHAATVAAIAAATSVST